MNNSHEIALWAGVAAFFGSLLAIGIFDVFNPDQVYEYLGALIIAAITAGAVYSKQRLEDAKKVEGVESSSSILPTPPPTPPPPPTTYQKPKPKPRPKK